LALALALLAALPATALALDGVRSTAPQPGAVLAHIPAMVRVALDAPLETAFLQLSVTGPHGRHVSGGAQRDPLDSDALVAPVPAAQVAPRPERSDRGPLMIVARLLALIGPIGLGGLAVLRFGVVAPAWRSGGPRRPGAPPPEDFRTRSAPALEAVMPRWWLTL